MLIPPSVHLLIMALFIGPSHECAWLPHHTLIESMDEQLWRLGLLHKILLGNGSCEAHEAAPNHGDPCKAPVVCVPRRRQGL